eukprot:TRINITY_DN22929_c0_g1_i1.p1 TRINITY_DN22929_c0_g1~~TRINITY_DN22929_c0_g1_i1.p1  ORF type:complete len:286 (-),score=60.43 TRINITY_DN22929_c0_g1_i1:57-881(-)
MFWDLSVSWDSKRAAALADLAVRLGFSGIAYNIVVSGQQVLNLRNHQCPIVFPKLPSSSSGPLSSSLGSDLGLDAKESHSSLLQFRRLTIVASDEAQVSAASQVVKLRPHYHLVAIRPTSEDAFLLACEKGVCDVISLSLDEKVPFQIRRKDVLTFLGRGGFFELELAPAIRDSGRRRAVIGNAEQLLHATRGRNVFLSSAAIDPIEMRSPHDMANFAAVLGLRGELAKKSISQVPFQALQRGVLRRGFAQVVQAPETSLDDPIAEEDVDMIPL